MNTYRTYFYSDLQWRECDIVARTPDEAIEIARRVAELDPEAIFPDYDEGCDRPMHAIEVIDDDGFQLAEWQGGELRSRLAAKDLLEGVALWQQGDLTEAVRQLDAAIAKAKGGAVSASKPSDGPGALRRANRGKVRDQADILFEREYRDGREVIYATTCYEGRQPWGEP